MSLSPAIIDALVASGVTVEQLAAAVKAGLVEQAARDTAAREDQEARSAAKREADRERQRRSRESRSTATGRRKPRPAAAEPERHAMSRSVTVTPRDTCDGSPNDIYLTPSGNPREAEASPPPLAHRVVEAWNTGPGSAGAPTARPLNTERRAALAARVREHGEAAVFEAIANLARSTFHCGRNDRNWRANLGWLLRKPESFQTALELDQAAPPPAAGTNGSLVAAILSRPPAFRSSPDRDRVQEQNNDQ